MPGARKSGNYKGLNPQGLIKSTSRTRFLRFLMHVLKHRVPTCLQTHDVLYNSASKSEMYTLTVEWPAREDTWIVLDL